MPRRDSVTGDGKAGTSGGQGGEGAWACCGGERSFRSAVPGDAVIIVIVQLCAGESLSFTRDRCSVLRMRCCQAEAPPGTGLPLLGDVVHLEPLRLSWSTWCLCGSPGNAVPYQEPAVLRVALPALGASSFGWIAGPPGWVLLSQACPYSPSTCGFSQPCIVHSCSVPGGEGRGGGWLSRHFWGVLSFWNLFRSLTLVFIRLSLKASD